LIIFAPEEAEIFKDYLFILAWFSVRLPLFSYDLKKKIVWSQICYITNKKICKKKRILTCTFFLVGCIRVIIMYIPLVHTTHSWNNLTNNWLNIVWTPAVFITCTIPLSFHLSRLLLGSVSNLFLKKLSYQKYIFLLLFICAIRGRYYPWTFIYYPPLRELQSL
jgi:hypothetical protein